MNKWQRIPDEQWLAFFGRRATYFMRQVERLRVGKRPEFLVEGFFFGLIWMLYRKMYLVAFCTMMLLLLESTIEEGIYYLLGISESFRAWVGLLISVLTGLAIGSFGTDLYLWHAEQKIRSEVDSKSVHIPEILIERIASRGGTSWYFLLGILALVVLAIVAANLVDLLEAF